MHRIDHPYAEADANGAGKDGFTEGVPGATPATPATDDWLNDVQEQLMQLCEQAGTSTTKGAGTDLYNAVQSLISASVTDALNTAYAERVRMALSNWSAKDLGATGEDIQRFAAGTVATGTGDDRLPIVVGVGGSSTVGRVVWTYNSGAQWYARTEDLADPAAISAIFYSETFQTWYIGTELGYIYSTSNPATVAFTYRGAVDGQINGIIEDGLGRILVYHEEAPTGEIQVSTDGVSFTGVNPSVIPSGASAHDAVYDAAQGCHWSVGQTSAGDPFVSRKPNSLTGLYSFTLPAGVTTPLTGVALSENRIFAVSQQGRVIQGSPRTTGALFLTVLNMGLTGASHCRIASDGRRTIVVVGHVPGDNVTHIFASFDEGSTWTSLGSEIRLDSGERPIMGAIAIVEDRVYLAATDSGNATYKAFASLAF